MQTKRNQTFLASVGLLTALTLTMAGCTPSSFTPGPGIPTQPNTPGQGSETSPVAFDTVQGQATLKGVPLKNAEVRVYNAITGAPAILSAGGANIVAAGGGNAQPVTTTDANGNFSVNLAGLTAGNVARVVITSEGKTVSALMDAGGGFVDRKSYVVAAGRQVNVSVTEISKLADILVAELLKTTNNVRDPERRGTMLSGILAAAASTATQAAPNFTGSDLDNLVNTPVAGSVTLSAAANASLSNNLGSSAATLATSIAAFATQLATLAAANQTNGGTVEINPASLPTIPGLTLTLIGGKLQIGDTVINVGTAPVVTDPNSTNSPPPPEVVFSPEVKKETDTKKGEWSYYPDGSGAFATVTFVDENTISVTQADKASQIQSLQLIVPTTSLEGNVASSEDFINSLSGTVTGRTQSTKNSSGATVPGTLREGNITFDNIVVAGHLATADIMLSGFGKIGTMQVAYQTTSFFVRMDYAAEDSAVEIVGGHTTTLSSDALDLISKSGVFISLATPTSSAQIQY